MLLQNREGPMAGDSTGVIIRRVSSAAKHAIGKSDLARGAYEQLSFLMWKAEIDRRARQGALCLHLGCGPRVLEGWLNADMMVRPRTLTMRLPEGLRRFDDASVKFIYASHVLEHITYPGEAKTFVNECHRILQPGGAVRVVVPGIEQIIDAYVRDDAAFFEVQRSFHPSWCTTKLEHLMYALQQDGEHKYGFDMETISKLFDAGGFRVVEKSGFNDSRFEQLRIDYRGEVDDRGNYLSLYVDAVKN
jgi:predicted SAM-dependent methyltransferase